MIVCSSVAAIDHPALQRGCHTHLSGGTQSSYLFCRTGPSHHHALLVPHLQYHRKQAGEKPFRPVGSCHKRLSMRDINPYVTEARPAPDIDFTLFATGG